MMKQLHPMKIQSQQSIPALPDYANVIRWGALTVQLFVIYWHKRCRWPYSSP